METEKEKSCIISGEMPVKRKPVPAGIIIYQEQPFVYLLSLNHRNEYCDFCFKKRAELSKCSICKYVYYCGRACQKQGWTVHKWECKLLKNIAPRVVPDTARLLYRLMIKLENGGTTYKGYYTPKNYRMWRDLMSHYAEIKEDERKMDHISSLYEVLKDFTQDYSLPNIVEFMGIYGRMCVNSFSISNQELQALGTGIYLGASILDHSCKPNAVVTFEGTTLIIRTLENLPELDWSKLRISYIDVLCSTKERQKELLETYYFLCDCVKCLAPENKSDMFGAACPNKSCGNSVEISDMSAKCEKCGTVLSSKFISEFKSVVEFTDMHLEKMEKTAYIDVCKLCLDKHKGLLYKYHLRHVKVLDLAFECAIDLENFELALEYGLELIQCYNKYYKTIQPLMGLLHLKLCKLLLYADRVKEGIVHLRKATDILKITHGTASSLYKLEVLPLIQQCRGMLNINGFK